MVRTSQIKALESGNREEFIAACRSLDKEELEALAKSEGLPGRAGQSREEIIEDLLRHAGKRDGEAPAASNSGRAASETEPFKEKQHGAWKDVPGKHR